MQAFMPVLRIHCRCNNALICCAMRPKLLSNENGYTHLAYCNLVKQATKVKKQFHYNSGYNGAQTVDIL